MHTPASTRNSDGRVALVTGGSRGLGRALTRELVTAGWRVVTDGRDAAALAEAVAAMPRAGAVTAVAGDVSDPAHRRALAEAVASSGGLDLLVNNASILGPSPLPTLAEYPVDALERVYAVNVLAPLALLQLLLPQLIARNGCIVNVSSDAAAEPYAGWGGYGSSKAALDHLSAILAVEQPGLRVYAFDPGDMNTDMHQQAFPGEDITDRPSPESVIPALLNLLASSRPSGRYRASDLAVAATR
jgi:NAD(P)-dependent dehydrogenase (short-subunit alcohol dehydrogenase family)